MPRHRNIAVLASGNGSNAENLIRYFNHDHDCGLHVALVVTNRPDARVVERARSLGVDVAIMTRQEINDPERMLGAMESHGIDIVVLAGFLLMVPQFLLHRYHDRVVNIHPSLLPRHGGKGMYGRHVHKAVIESGDSHSGITIHMVSEEYDRGRIIFQKAIDVPQDCTPEHLEGLIHALEREYFPHVIRDTFAGDTW